MSLPGLRGGSLEIGLRMLRGLFFCLAIGMLSAGCIVPRPNVGRPPERTLPPHTLVIGMDGVGYDAMKLAHEHGLFPEFMPPSRMVSPFPTLSIVCFTEMIEGLTGFRNPGYDVWYYDPVRQEVIGGTHGDGFELSHPYLWFFDIARRDGYSHDIAYFFPRISLRRDLRTLEREFRGERRPNMVYLLSTDAIAHVYGRDELLRQLKRVSRSLTRIQRRYEKKTGHPLKIVMFSDHGQDWGQSWRLSDRALRNALQAAGYRNTTALRDPKDVIVVSFGNVRIGILYAALEDRPGVAEVVSRQPGVELTFYRTPTGATVVTRNRGQARIECGDGRYRYFPESGDPLNYAPVAEQLRTAGQLDPEGWASAQVWFDATLGHRYPDALHRVCNGFRDMVLYPADVMFHMEKGSMFGPWNLEAGSTLAFGGIKGNHGGIAAVESSAFLISNDHEDPLPPAVPFDQAVPEAIFRGDPPPPPPVPPMIDNAFDR